MAVTWNGSWVYTIDRQSQLFFLLPESFTESLRHCRVWVAIPLTVLSCCWQNLVSDATGLSFAGGSGFDAKSKELAGQSHLLQLVLEIVMTDQRPLQSKLSHQQLFKTTSVKPGCPNCLTYREEALPWLVARRNDMVLCNGNGLKKWMKGETVFPRKVEWMVCLMKRQLLAALCFPPQGSAIDQGQFFRPSSVEVVEQVPCKNWCTALPLYCWLKISKT